VNCQYLQPLGPKKRPMIFTNRKPLSHCVKVLHDEDMPAASAI